MLEAKKTSATLVFSGATTLNSAIVIGHLSAVSDIENPDVCGDPQTVQARTPEGVLTLTLATSEDRNEHMLEMVLTPLGERDDTAAQKAFLAQLTAQLVSAMQATHVLWMGNPPRLTADEFLCTLSLTPTAPQTEQNIQLTGAPMTTTTMTAPRRITSTATAPRKARPAPGQHAQIKAVAKAARVHARPANGVDAVFSIDPTALANMLPMTQDTRRVAANDRPFSVLDGRISLQESSVRTCLNKEATEAELEDIKGPVPVEARLSTWAVSLSVATISLPLAAPVLAYNVVRGEDFRFASLSLALAGFFTALSGSGAMANILPF